ncbi:8-amino-7-oxononanoate synthase [Prosthecobacter debontii]|uniref:8-amino-7-ketopelargonate synthase n=1 Tax=Prosthecobacter debontii TaxID=48467 RepID=A0A1T4Y3S9_9BACT|nr:8-amino-7-oxononanoate synthase [Prosthecobacter debontii]SKA96396.1 8-amino-7-oxononanoate synthase [Prosthecobacter debontii]
MSWQIQAELDELRDQGLWRDLRRLDSPQEPVVQLQGKTYLNFSSNDYLGLAASETLKAALHEAIVRYGAGSGASRLVCGTMSPHLELEEALAAFKGSEAALTFTSGFAVPIGTLPALLGPGDTVILDKLSHACLVDAAKLSGATLRVFPHNHLEKLERLLQTAKGRVLVVTESIFSMDGDAARLREIVELKDRYGAWLLLDEAHAVGVLGPQGRGLAASLGLEKRVELQMGTLSKAFGLSGGYLAASRAVVDLLINRARSFIYTTAPSPAVAAAAGVALGLIQGPEGDRRREALQQHVRQVRAVVEGAGQTDPAQASSAIIPLIIGDEKVAVETSAALREAGFLVPAIRYPTVARGTARLRITLSAAHQAQQVDALLAQLKA